MNLRSAKASEPNVPEEAAPDPRRPHNFQEVHSHVETSVCALSRRSRSDRIHLSAEENQSPRWGL